MTQLSPLLAISPIDGRYHSKCVALNQQFSEFALIRNRLQVEVEWLIELANEPNIKELPVFSADTLTYLRNIVLDFSPEEAQKVKDFEAEINHDVKAVEYYLKHRIQSDQRAELTDAIEFIHFSCTSEDINNLSYALSLANSFPLLNDRIASIIAQLTSFSQSLANTPMLSKTHGQPASPSTIGKEFANVVARLKRQHQYFMDQPFLGKINGAVGNFNAHLCAYPDVKWDQLAERLVSRLGLQYNAYTTQIEPHDYYAEYFQTLSRINTILIDFAQDIWGYISFGLFSQKVLHNEVGSSAMPHKVNPIDFENAEGNLGLSNALLNHLSAKLPISRFQRDLSDSTVQRSIGTAIAHAYLAWQSFEKGLGKLQANATAMEAELTNNPQVLAEAIQTVMRRYGIEQPYEQLKALTRGQAPTLEILRQFVEQQLLPEQIKAQLLSMQPQDYIGNAAEKANQV